MFRLRFTRFISCAELHLSQSLKVSGQNNPRGSMRMYTVCDLYAQLTCWRMSSVIPVLPVSGELCVHPAKPLLSCPQRNTRRRAISGASFRSPDEVSGAPEEEERAGLLRREKSQRLVRTSWMMQEMCLCLTAQSHLDCILWFLAFF